MATLLPTLSSDDEDENDDNNNNVKVVIDSGKKQSKKKKQKQTKTQKEKQPIVKNKNDNDDDDDDDDEINKDFVFGGILGEDGGLSSSSNNNNNNVVVQEGWSYQSALNSIINGQSDVSAANPRMDVASLIAAKRQLLLKEKKDSSSKNDNDNNDEDDEEKETINKKKEDESSSDDDDDDSDSGSDSNSSSNNNNIKTEEKNKKDDSSSSSDSDDDDDDDQVDDADQEMEQDVLKTRMGEKDEEKGTKNKNGKKKQLEEKEEDENDNEEDDEESGDDNDDDDDEEEEESDEDDDDDDDEADREEAEKAANFFDTTTTTITGGNNENDDIEVFAQLTLSRPLLRGVAAMGYVKPTPIQASVIPVALAGRDICASAVTGSGKTAAFVLPVLERLLYRPQGMIKALILTPTRELAAQIIGMMSTLSQFTKITSSLIVGGSKNLNSQMAELRARPQVVVATPGRLLDHVMNSTGVTLEDVEFLILDEADRLLDLGFQEEVTELIKACPINGRQTMLFSATMNTKVDDLIKLSLKRPVRIRITGKETSGGGGGSSSSAASPDDLEVAPRLEQEFVRVRSGNEGINREGMLLALLTRTFSTQTIVFFDTKAKAHRMMILCGLCGIKCAELHGNLTQAQRLEALEKFRKGEVDILLATDLAARGLDISRVETVINFEMPNQVETYIHRIGRTARAGRGGRSCTLIGEGRRHLMKEIIKDAADKNKTGTSKKKNNSNSNNAAKQTAVIRSRSIPSAVIGHFVAKIQSLEPHVEEVLQAEAVARMDRLADMEAAKAQNIIAHSSEIQSRPQRQWFISEKEKQQTREAATEKAKAIAEKVGTGLHRMTRKKRRAREAKQMLEEYQNETNESDNNGGGGENNDNSTSPKSKTSVPSIKQVARQKKREEEERQRERNNMSIHDLDMERAKKKQKRKGASAQDAFGDSSLFSEEKTAYAPKKSKKDKDGDGGGEDRVQSNYHFRGYDPTKDGKKKPKKKGVHKFKSKSKFKRR